MARRSRSRSGTKPASKKQRRCQSQDLKVPQTSPLLSLPSHLLQRILASAGAGARGTFLACRDLRDAWQLAMSDPSHAARYILDRYGKESALRATAVEEPAYLALTRVIFAPCKAAKAVGQSSAQVLNDRRRVSRERALVLLQGLVSLGAEAGQPQLVDALSEAVVAGHTKLVWALLRLGADPAAPATVQPVPRGDPGYHTPFDVALVMGDIEAAQLFLDVGYSPCSSGDRSRIALLFAAQAPTAEPVRVVLAMGMDARRCGYMGLTVAMSLGDRDDTVSELLAAGAHEGGGDAVEQRRLLERACEHGCVPACRALLRLGLRPRGVDRWDSCLEDAKKHGHREVARLLREAGWESESESEEESESESEEEEE